MIYPLTQNKLFNEQKMNKKIILQTHRLSLREFELTDTEFIINLLNSPNWLEFIGDIQNRTQFYIVKIFQLQNKFT